MLNRPATLPVKKRAPFVTLRPPILPPSEESVRFRRHSKGLRLSRKPAPIAAAALLLLSNIFVSGAASSSKRAVNEKPDAVISSMAGA